MCGIWGTTRNYSREWVERKLARARFRGPDATGCISAEGGITLGHNRLSILDLDERANQPFSYGDLVVVHNGEIYNFKALRKELRALGFHFTTECDTEVVAAAYQAWGPEAATRLFGMFAFVVYDKKHRLLFGARDRLGQKPFYYAQVHGHFEFASQPSQIALGNQLSVDDRAITQLLKWKYIPAPGSIYKEIRKLRPGHWFTYSLDTQSFQERQYWNIAPATQKPAFRGSYEEAKEILKTRIQEAVSDRMISDVPLGVFLSGGVDSSLIAAMAQGASTDKIRTFCVQFEEAGYDESKYAQEVSEILGTDHTVIPCNYEEGVDLVRDLPTYYDEPFSDSSAIPSMLSR